MILLSVIKTFFLRAFALLNVFILPLWLGGLLVFGYQFTLTGEPIMLLDTFLLPARIVLFFGYLLVVFACFCLFFSLVAHELLLGLASRFLVYRLTFLLNFGLFVYAVGTLVGFRLLRETLKDVLNEFPVVFDQLVAEEFLEFGFEFAGGTAQGLGFWVFPVLIASLFTSFFEHHLYLVFFFYCFVPVGWFRLLQGGAEFLAVIPVISGSQAVEKVVQVAMNSLTIVKYAEDIASENPRVIAKLDFEFRKNPNAPACASYQIALTHHKFMRAMTSIGDIQIPTTPRAASRCFDLFHPKAAYSTPKLCGLSPVERVAIQDLVLRFDKNTLSTGERQFDFISRNPDRKGWRAFTSPQETRDDVVERIGAKYALRNVSSTGSYARLPTKGDGDFVLVSDGLLISPAFEVKGIWGDLPSEEIKALAVILQKAYGIKDLDAAGIFSESQDFSPLLDVLSRSSQQPASLPRVILVVFGQPEHDCSYSLCTLQQSLDRLKGLPIKENNAQALIGGVTLIDGTDELD